MGGKEKRKTVILNKKMNGLLYSIKRENIPFFKKERKKERKKEITSFLNFVIVFGS